MNNIAKTIILISLIIVVIGAVTLNIINKKKVLEEINKNAPTISDTNTSRNLCYYRADKTDRGFYDKAWLKLNIAGEKVKGEFQHLPAESDSKVGTFEGTLGVLDQKSMSREATVWWNSRAEGMEVKEELEIKWGDGNATVGFGEMIDRGDGVYVYKDKTKLFYIKSMDQVDCVALDEKLSVEQYVRENISNISTEKAVLGGTWYALLIVANPTLKTGEVIYEDGHIQHKATFNYDYNESTQKISISNFTITK